MSLFADLLEDARDHARPFIADAVTDRRKRPLHYALAHSYAATEYRLQADDAQAEGRRGAAWWLRQRARFHRKRREHFRRHAKAMAVERECEQMLATLRAL